MRHLTLSLVLAGTVLSLPVLAASPSFDCAKATHEAEKMICKDGELAKLDRSLAALYSSALKDASGQDKRDLKDEQRDWIKDRNACSRNSDMRGCIVDEYRVRIDQLVDR